MDVEIPGNANENRQVWGRKSPDSLFGDPDSKYVRDYLEKVVAHFRECNIHPEIVVRYMIDSMIKYAPGDPYETKTLPDEADLHLGSSIIGPAAQILSARDKAYRKAIDRHHAARITRIAEKHGCSREEAFQLWVAYKDGEGTVPP